MTKTVEIRWNWRCKDFCPKISLLFCTSLMERDAPLPCDWSSTLMSKRRITDKNLFILLHPVSLPFLCREPITAIIPLRCNARIKETLFQYNRAASPFVSLMVPGKVGFCLIFLHLFYLSKIKQRSNLSVCVAIDQSCGEAEVPLSTETGAQQRSGPSHS